MDGEPLANAVVEITSVGPKRKLSGASNSHGVVILDQVPIGLYDVDVTLAGFRSRRERIGVYQDEISFRLGLVLGYPSSAGRSAVLGSISRTTKNGPRLWVRLVPLFGGELIENSVDKSGEFRLLDVPPGIHVLLVLQGETVLATRRIDVGLEPLTISIPLDEKRP
jgi:hypothetical protein